VLEKQQVDERMDERSSLKAQARKALPQGVPPGLRESHRVLRASPPEGQHLPAPPVQALRQTAWAQP
jgi:hypothetical protein